MEQLEDSESLFAGDDPSASTPRYQVRTRAGALLGMPWGGGHKPPGTVPSFLIQEAKRVQTRGPNTEPPAGAQTDSLVSAAGDGGNGDSTGSPRGGHRDGWGGGCTPGTGVGAPKLPRVLLLQVPKEEGAGPTRILPTTVAPRMPSVSTAPRGGCSAMGRGGDSGAWGPPRIHGSAPSWDGDRRPGGCGAITPGCLR